MKAGQKDVPTMNDWLCDNLAVGSSVGVDAYLISANSAKDLESDLRRRGISLKAVHSNLIDIIWGSNQPSPPTRPINPHPVKFSGESHVDKISKLRSEMGDHNAGAIVVTMLDEVGGSTTHFIDLSL